MYICALFLPAIGLWNMKLYWDSRYCIHGDVCHLLFEVATHVCIASAVQHVRPVSILADVKHNVDMFAYCVSIFGGYMLAIFRFLEVFLCAKVFQTKGLHDECLHAVKRDIQFVVVPTIFFFAATVYSGNVHFAFQEDKSKAEEASSSTYDDVDHYRVLAGTESSFYSDVSTTDIPAWLCLAGALSWFLCTAFTILFLTKRAQSRGTDLKKCVDHIFISVRPFNRHDVPARPYSNF